MRQVKSKKNKSTELRLIGLQKDERGLPKNTSDMRNPAASSRCLYYPSEPISNSFAPDISPMPARLPAHKPHHAVFIHIPSPA